jgi:hypothetical protein
MMSRSKKRGRPTAQESANRDLGLTICKQEAEIDELRNIIKERDNAIVGYKAVISYLEFQHGMKESQ